MSFALSTVALIGLAVSATAGTAKAVDGGIKAKKARIAAEKSQVELDKQRNSFAQLDTSNPYSNMENTMEDLTVNTQAAEFEKQQNMQQQANLMQGMRGAAGSSGIAGLAQTLASSGALQAQKASAGIGTQEAANQKITTAEASRVQGKVIGGEVDSRAMQAQKVKGLLGMAGNDLAADKAAQAAGQAQMHEGIAAVGQAATDAAGTGALGGAKSTPNLLDGSKLPTQAEVDATGFVGTPEEFQAKIQGLDLSGVSDRRLKSDINKIGLSPSGLNIYSFKYINELFGKGIWQGVMSDEIPSEHVHKLGEYDLVDYSRLDVEFKQL